MRLGFSTGCFYKEGLELKELLKVLKGETIELSALRSHEMPFLLRVEKEAVEKFERVSIHAPSTLKGEDLELSSLERAAKALRAEAVVIHPSQDLKVENLRSYSIPYAFENMDARKGVFSTAGEISRLLKKVDAKACIDVSHCFSVDKSGALLSEMLKVFEGNISHIHLSGYCANKKNGHCSLREAEALPSELPNVDTIIESPISLEEMDAEMEAARELSLKA